MVHQNLITYQYPFLFQAKHDGQKSLRHLEFSINNDKIAQTLHPEVFQLTVLVHLQLYLPTRSSERNFSNIFCFFKVFHFAK